jgi:hypothetical protein
LLERLATKEVKISSKETELKSLSEAIRLPIALKSEIKRKDDEGVQTQRTEQAWQSAYGEIEHQLRDTAQNSLKPGLRSSEQQTSFAL